ncbi:hypothetical protein ACSBR2_033238 [Camellia fascicularis]
MLKAGLVGLALGLIMFINFTGQCHGDGALQFRVGFYDGKCNGEDVEAIVRLVIQESYMKDPTLVAVLVRMQFHDCFVTVSKSFSKNLQKNFSEFL